MFEDIMNIFGGMSADNYESRKIANWESKDLLSMVDTCSVTDGQKPYETAVQHPEYNGGEMIIVESYDDDISALTGHKKWLKLMQEDKLPRVLTDCCNADISQLIDKVGGTMSFERDTKKE
jgi:hypothetical protein